MSDYNFHLTITFITFKKMSHIMSDTFLFDKLSLLKHKFTGSILSHPSTTKADASTIQNKPSLFFCFHSNVKIYNVEDYSVVATLNYPSPILSMASAVSVFERKLIITKTC